ncbi:MAG TPA: DinB family protein, partial [Gemmatimonadaceae bacterium]
MQQQLQRIVDSLESAQSRLRKLADRIPVEAWARRPAVDAWSAVECVEHLNLTSRAYVPLLRSAIAEARELRAETAREYKRDFTGAFLGAMIGPLRQVGKFRLMRVKTTDDFV